MAASCFGASFNQFNVMYNDEYIVRMKFAMQFNFIGGEKYGPKARCCSFYLNVLMFSSKAGPKVA